MRLSDHSGDNIAFLHGIHGSDHHMIAFARSNAPGHHHFSWDVGTVDEIGEGAMHMLDKGFSKGWGLGRHVLGSNFFHYVQDPWGSFCEYSADIDYVPSDCNWPAGDHPAEDVLRLGSQCSGRFRAHLRGLTRQTAPPGRPLDASMSLYRNWARRFAPRSIISSWLRELLLRPPSSSSTSTRINFEVVRGTDTIGVMTEDAAVIYRRSGTLAILNVKFAARLPYVGVVTRTARMSNAVTTFLTVLRAECGAFRR